jgi:hypothetical protein
MRDILIIISARYFEVEMIYYYCYPFGDVRLTVVLAGWVDNNVEIDYKHKLVVKFYLRY